MPKISTTHPEGLSAKLSKALMAGEDQTADMLAQFDLQQANQHYLRNAPNQSTLYKQAREINALVVAKQVIDLQSIPAMPTEADIEKHQTPTLNRILNDIAQQPETSLVKVARWIQTAEQLHQSGKEYAAYMIYLTLQSEQVKKAYIDPQRGNVLDPTLNRAMRMLKDNYEKDVRGLQANNPLLEIKPPTGRYQANPKHLAKTMPGKKAINRASKLIMWGRQHQALNQPNTENRQATAAAGRTVSSNSSVASVPSQANLDDNGIPAPPRPRSRAPQVKRASRRGKHRKVRHHRTRAAQKTTAASPKAYNSALVGMFRHVKGSMPHAVKKDMKRGAEQQARVQTPRRSR